VNAVSSAASLTADDLRSLFLFERLDDNQLAWLMEHGQIETCPAGTAVIVEGEPATCFFVLLDGTVALCRNVGGERVEVSRSDQRGSYFGAVQAYLEGDVNWKRIYRMTVESITDTVMYQLPADEFGPIIREWFPMAMHLLEGLFFGMRNQQTVVSERERLLALGSLSAGLTHELNNPAAAAVRATSVLRQRVAGMRSKLAMIADGRLDASQLHKLVELQEEAAKRAASAPELSPLATSDAEDTLADWLDERDIAGAWDISPTLVAGGVDPEWLGKVAGTVGEEYLEGAVRWLTYTIDTEMLMSEIEDSVTRISGLVAAAKQYSQLDRAPHQTADVHELLKATLVMLKAKIPPGVRVEKDFDRSLPPIPVYAAELNQVWTNLIDNALSAMDGEGQLTLRTFLENDMLIVEIGDTGPGIPADIRPRIFEPFFTTKPVGEGTGLGLDISYRIVVNKHHGDIRVETQPGDTRFQVRLPIESPVLAG
jgi:signal transduction histidine kinase